MLASQFLSGYLVCLSRFQPVHVRCELVVWHSLILNQTFFSQLLTYTTTYSETLLHSQIAITAARRQ